MRQVNLNLPVAGAIYDKHYQRYPQYDVDADEDCRMDAEQVALVATAGFKSLGSEIFRTKPCQSGTAKTTSFATVQAIYV